MTKETWDKAVEAALSMTGTQSVDRTTVRLNQLKGPRLNSDEAFAEIIGEVGRRRGELNIVCGFTGRAPSGIGENGLPVLLEMTIPQPSTNLEIALSLYDKAYRESIHFQVSNSPYGPSDVRDYIATALDDKPEKDKVAYVLTKTLTGIQYECW